MNTSTSRRTVLVTGATGAIGLAIARQIAAKPGHEVVLLGRNEHKARQAAQAIRSATGNDGVSYALVDLGLRSSIEEFATGWGRPVHALVNNAVIAPPRREETTEGIEVQFAVNVLGYYRLTRALEKRLIEAAPSRVVNVASYWAGDLQLHDLEFKRRPYGQHQAYRQSKQANRMLAAAFAGRLEPHGVSVNACHSGDVHSTLSHALGFGGHESPDQGAATPVWLAVDAGGAQATGKYFEHCRQVRCRFMEDAEQVAELEAACRRYG